MNSSAKMYASRLSIAKKSYFKTIDYPPISRNETFIYDRKQTLIVKTESDAKKYPFDEIRLAGALPKNA